MREEREREIGGIASIKTDPRTNPLSVGLLEAQLPRHLTKKMAAKYVVLALAALCIAQASAASRTGRSADATPSLESLLEETRNRMNQINTEFTNWVQSPSLDEVKAIFTNKTHELEVRAKSVLDEAKRQLETHGSEFSERANQALQEATTQFNEAVKKLKESAPGVMTQASEVAENFENSFKAAVDTMIDESGKLFRAAGEDAGAAHDALSDISKKAMDNTMAVLNQMRTEMDQAVSRATAS